MVGQRKLILLGCKEKVNRQQLIYEESKGEEAIRKQACRQMQEVPYAELLAKERLRRQMIVFAHTRGLGPANDMAQSISELLSCQMEEYELCTPLGTPLGPPSGILQPQAMQRTPSKGQGWLYNPQRI